MKKEKSTLKLTVDIPLALANEVRDYCKRMNINQKNVVIRALEGRLLADKYLQHACKTK